MTQRYIKQELILIMITFVMLFNKTKKKIKLTGKKEKKNLSKFAINTEKMMEIMMF